MKNGILIKIFALSILGSVLIGLLVLTGFGKLKEQYLVDIITTSVGVLATAIGFHLGNKKTNLDQKPKQ